MQLRHQSIIVVMAFACAVCGCHSNPDGEERDSETVAPQGDAGRPDSGAFAGDTVDSDTPDSDSIDTGTTPMKDVCSALNHARDTHLCAHAITDEDTWDALTIASTGTDRIALTKYVMGTEDSMPVPLSFMNVNIHRLHYDFLLAAFPELFTGIGPVDYLQLAMAGAARRLMVGTVALFSSDPDDERFYGFTVLDDTNAPENVVTYDQIERLHRELSARFTLGPLTFVPETQAQIEAAATWNADFPVAGPSGEVGYEVYTMGDGFGTVRIMTAAELQQATVSGEIGFQDILVLDETPSDLERVVSGTVTGTRQGILSHLNVRSSARGTPNCFVREPREAFEDWEGMLVRLTCGAETFEIRKATVDSAEAAWEALRPEPVSLRPLDDTFAELTSLTAIPTDDVEERMTAADRFGAKTANLAVLYQRIRPELGLSGFGVPFYYYEQFMTRNQWMAETDSGAKALSFKETIAAWSGEERFVTDSMLRRSRLVALQRAMENAEVDADLISALENAILEVFDSDTAGVRFRSAGNAEDVLWFSGAGLYDSTKACLADETDGDSVGPSRCYPDEHRERDLSRAVKKVWASLWNPAAYEERTWYGIGQLEVAMGILVNTRIDNEAANIVAFTGNPVTGDPDYLINAQAGEWDVVSSVPGVYPETTLLEMEGGAVSMIRRMSESSQVEPGEHVLADALLLTLGGRLAEIAAVYPIDSAPPREAVLFYDTEWKLIGEDTLVIKQIRPYVSFRN